ncbi:hypothetical protein MN0502_14820 [Arthrobacter sp. MN05-02]|nr:hypothetical protein MN0502_14820 [Arthrobacter sp. MN05-02]
MGAAAWAEDLAESLNAGRGGPSSLTVGTGADTEAIERIVDTARKVAEAAGYPVHELSALNVTGDPRILPEDGFIILRDVRRSLPVAVPVLVGAYQHLVRRGLRVGMLVVGSPAGIKALRRHPGMDFLGLADVMTEPEAE